MEPEKKPENRIVQTYAEDMAKVIGENQEGLIKKIIHGEEAHEMEKKNLSPESKRNKIFMLVSIILIILALVILSFFFFKKNANTVPVQQQFMPLIFNDQSTYLEILGFKKDEIAQTVLSEVNAKKVKIGGVEGIYLTENKQIIGLRRFLTLIKSSFTPGSNTLFVSDNFLMGGVNVEVTREETKNEGFFILLKVRSTADIFDTLRAWEGKMFTEMRGFFGIEISSDTSYLMTKNFEEGIVENKNARILYDKNNKIVMMYIFANENSVIITDSQKAAHEIILRLASSQKEQ